MPQEQNQDIGLDGLTDEEERINYYPSKVVDMHQLNPNDPASDNLSDTTEAEILMLQMRQCNS